MIASFMLVGFRHIMSLAALDHLLFLAALAASYRPQDWRHGLAVITAFTAGHSVTLAVVALGVLRVPATLVEFLIPVTIVIAAAENVLHRKPRPAGIGRPLLAGGFGLVHGAGFAGTLDGLFDGQVVLPLLGFNIGIELGQLLVLCLLVALFTAFDRVVATDTRARCTSMAVACVAVVIAFQRLPW